MFSFGLIDAQAAKKTLPPPSNSVTDEEVQKRNTDCIYFLASPLTCKKGTNCEYRHSEAARMNPRDCRFWKAGNCLNPRCSFRHLPLDGKPASAASIASTSSAPIILQSIPAASSSNKSQTPCYFFSQGYCAKNEKCSFMHGLSAASGGDAPIQINPAAELDEKVSYSSEKPSNMPKQYISTVGRPVATNGSHTLSKVPVSWREITRNSSGLGKSKASESNGTSISSGAPLKFRKPIVPVDRPYDVEQSQFRQQRLQDRAHCDGMFVQDDLFQGNAWWDDQSAVQSDSHQIIKSPSNSVGSNGQASIEQSRSDDSEQLPNEVPQSRALGGHLQTSKYASDPRATTDDRAGKCIRHKMSSEEKDASSDLRNHLMKRRKKDSSLAVSQKLDIRGQTGITTKGNGSQRRSEVHHVHELEGKLLAKAVNCGGKAPKSEGIESSVSLQNVSLNKTSNTGKCPPAQDNNLHGASGGTSKREVTAFTGPKSLAQIKAEKMASASKFLGKDTITAEAGTKLAARKLGGVGSVQHSDASMCTGLSVTKSAYLKEKTATSVEFEGPKPLSVLLKRKREVDSDSDVRDATSVPLEAQVSMPFEAELSMALKVDTCGELEDGEVSDDSTGCEQESLPPPACSSKEDSEAMPPRSREGLQRGTEPAEYEMESLEDSLKYDAEMKDIEYDNVGCEIDDVTGCALDEDDDDDDDFAKKLGRFFTFTSS